LGGRESIEIGYLPASENPWGLAIVDLNNDGSDDLIVADDQSGGATIYLSAGCDE